MVPVFSSCAGFCVAGCLLNEGVAGNLNVCMQYILRSSHSLMPVTCRIGCPLRESATVVLCL